jgi:hypothetical protein
MPTTKTASVTGLWTNTATWGGAAVPIDGDTVIISTGITVYFDDDHGPHGKNFTTGLAGLVITGTLRFPTANMNGSGLTPTAMNALDGYMLIMASGISITGTGSLFVGDAATTGNYIARSAAASAGSPCVPTVTITLTGAANITTTTVHFYGWIPTTPTAHPNYTTIAGQASTIASAASGQAVVNVATGTGASFLANQTVTISDANNTETNTIATIATDAITLNNNLAHTYSSATITTVGACACATTGVWSATAFGSQSSGQPNVIVVAGNGALFTKGQSVTISDSNAQENNIISSITGDTLTMATNLSNTYTSGNHGAIGATSYPGGQAVLYLTDDLGLQVGDLVVIGAGMPANTFLAVENTTTNHPITGSASRGVYTVSAYDSGTKKLTLTGNHGLGRLVGDIVARYNRPIAVMKATYENTQGALGAGVLQGVLVYRMRGFSSTSAQFIGCTMDSGANNTAALGGLASGDKFIDCTATYCSLGGLASNSTNNCSVNNYFQGCAGVNNGNGGLAMGDIGDIFVNCVCENCTGGMADAGSGNTLIDCAWRAGAYGFFGYSGNVSAGGVSNRAVECVSSLNNLSATTYNGDLVQPKGETRLYGCTLASTTPVYGYTAALRAPQETIQSYDHGGVAGARYCWGRGGHGLTGAYSTPYNAYVNPMKFVVEVQNTASVSGILLWDVPFEMPANTTLTVSVPMARDTLNIAAELWILSQYNDPLWFDPSWQVTPTQSTSSTAIGSPTTTYVASRSALSAATGTWQTVMVTVPAYPYARKLTARVIGANNTAATGNFYADLDTLDKMLLKRRRIFL